MHGRASEKLLWRIGSCCNGYTQMLLTMNGAKVFDGLDRDDRLLGPPAALAQEAEHGFVLSQQLKWRCRKEIYLTS